MKILVDRLEIGKKTLTGQICPQNQLLCKSFFFETSKINFAATQVTLQMHLFLKSAELVTQLQIALNL